MAGARAEVTDGAARRDESGKPVDERNRVCRPPVIALGEAIEDPRRLVVDRAPAQMTF
jgi:hypothetical protein